MIDAADVSEMSSIYYTIPAAFRCERAATSHLNDTIRFLFYVTKRDQISVMSIVTSRTVLAHLPKRIHA